MASNEKQLAERHLTFSVSVDSPIVTLVRRPDGTSSSSSNSWSIGLGNLIKYIKQPTATSKN